MPGYRDMWKLLRTARSPVEVTQGLGLPPSKVLRLLQSKRLRKLVEMDMLIVAAQIETGSIGQNRRQQGDEGQSGGANGQVADGNERETGEIRQVRTCLRLPSH